MHQLFFCVLHFLIVPQDNYGQCLKYSLVILHIVFLHHLHSFYHCIYHSHIFHLHSNVLRSHLFPNLYISYHLWKNTSRFRHHANYSLIYYCCKIGYLSSPLLHFLLSRLHNFYRYIGHLRIFHLHSNVLRNYLFPNLYTSYHLWRNTSRFRHHTTSLLNGCYCKIGYLSSPLLHFLLSHLHNFYRCIGHLHIFHLHIK